MARPSSNGATELLGFNEPDGSDQSNIPVDEALRLWPDMQQPGVLLGSPATAAEGWEEDFMAAVAAQHLRVDFIAMHWYGWDQNHFRPMRDPGLSRSASVHIGANDMTDIGALLSFS
ncbi:MAG TPA: glycosyl hydrolase [Polyangiaceae bacterium]|jgi:hypothetical protein|nr:glycosyl hydrolase [Polyangiaceae bacterium]